MSARVVGATRSSSSSTGISTVERLPCFRVSTRRKAFVTVTRSNWFFRRSKTSGGKYIAPQYVESTLAGDPYIEQLIVIADGRPYATALIVPAFDALEAYAKTWNIATSSREELVRDPILVRFFEGRIEARQKDLAGYEKVKRIALLPRPFSQEAGEITPTLKVRRRVIIEKYHDLIDAMYAREKEASTPAPESDLSFSAP